MLIAEDETLIAGHGRVLAARLLGMDTVSTITLPGISEAQRRALVLADNRIALNAGWDEALLALELSDLKEAGIDLGISGFEEGELDRPLSEAEEDEDPTGPVVIPEPSSNPASRTGDPWILGDHRLLCGDLTSPDEACRLMNGERAVLFATDPPYLVDYDGSIRRRSRSTHSESRSASMWHAAFASSPVCGSGSQIMAGEANVQRVFAMEVSPAYVDVGVERWPAETGKDAILEGDGRTFAELKAERLGNTPEEEEAEG